MFPLPEGKGARPRTRERTRVRENFDMRKTAEKKKLTDVEALTIAALVEEGAVALRTLYANGVSSQDFPIYDEEFKWIESRLAKQKTVNRRVMRQRFPDFEWTGIPSESVKDLAAELKEERAFESVNNMLATLGERLERDNALELAAEARELLTSITRQHSPLSDHLLEDWVDDIAEIRRWRAAAKAGAPIGLKTGFAHLDHHWGGLLPGQMQLVLGRTGEGKSLKTYAMGLNAKLQGASVGIFTPELSKHEVKCRVHTLASARKDIQKALGLPRSFRNRALMNREGYNLKSYATFCEYFKEELPGKMHLLSGIGRHDQMSVGYIEDRIVELELDYVIIDPIYLLKPVMVYRDNPYATLGSTAEAVERLSEMYNIPITITNQAHRQGGGAGDAPHKDKSFGSDLPAQLADFVLGVKHLSDESRMICRCTKSRFGQEFRYEIGLHANTGAIRELTPLEGNYFNGKGDMDEEELRDMVASAQKGKGDDD